MARRRPACQPLLPRARHAVHPVHLARAEQPARQTRPRAGARRAGVLSTCAFTDPHPFVREECTLFFGSSGHTLLFFCVSCLLDNQQRTTFYRLCSVSPLHSLAKLAPKFRCASTIFYTLKLYSRVKLVRKRKQTRSGRNTHERESGLCPN